MRFYHTAQMLSKSYAIKTCNDSKDDQRAIVVGAPAKHLAEVVLTWVKLLPLLAMVSI